MNKKTLKLIKALGIIGVLFIILTLFTGGFKTDGKQVTVRTTLVKPNYGDTYIQSYAVDIGGECSTPLSLPQWLSADGDMKVQVGDTLRLIDYHIYYFPEQGESTYEINMGCIKAGTHPGSIKIFHKDGRLLDTKTFEVYVSKNE